MLQIKGAPPLPFRDSIWRYEAKLFSFETIKIKKHNVSESEFSSSIRQNILNLPS
jgi:phosphatidylethanolamine-binding protein (PEBP) family uncharacterized protein